MGCIWKRGLWDVIRSWEWSPNEWVSYKRPQGGTPDLPPCRDTEKRWLSMNHEAGPHQTPNLLAPWSALLHLQDCEKEMPVVWATQTMVLVLQQLEWTKAHLLSTPFHLSNWVLPLPPTYPPRSPLLGPRMCCSLCLKGFFPLVFP